MGSINKLADLASPIFGSLGAALTGSVNALTALSGGEDEGGK